QECPRPRPLVQSLQAHQRLGYSRKALAPMRGRRAAKREPGTAWNRGEPQSGRYTTAIASISTSRPGAASEVTPTAVDAGCLPVKNSALAAPYSGSRLMSTRNTPSLTTLASEAPAAASTVRRFSKARRTWALKSPSCITWPSAETLVWPDTKMTLWAPVTFHAWEKPRRSCQVHGLIWVFSTRHPPVFCLSRCVLWLARSAYPHGPPRHRVRPSLRQAGRERDGQRNAVRVFEVDDGAGGHLDQPGVLHAVLVEPGDPRFQVLASGDGETDVVEPRPPGREALSAGSAEPD